MRRVVIALGSTIAGLAMLLSFKSHGAAAGSAPATAAPGAASPAQGSGTADGSGSAAGPAGAASGAGSGTTGTGTPGTSGAPGAPGRSGGSGRTGTAGGQAAQGGSATRTVAGAADETQYGPMQIALTLTGQRITKVTVLQETNTGAESQQIDSFAIPRLTSETLAAQSARIDAVSGASYTSAGYIQSLQSAIDKARG